ncbi:type II restriction endonuclease [Limosilactobacillus reuteri]|uniref:type II restriction endonuclease n=1 Tax=Limosilactobacillus reuteri TaxID=1598 RepID=UPI001E3F7B56|nr:type II restriction endonuclease [Limosilactobacillus reuteri]MCC4398292.1 type II restriction endonuclease [Limosilactobacillus reuteri]MCC4409874.1 type II restriction endonuclease [Limosilactobacillus reuteri]
MASNFVFLEKEFETCDLYDTASTPEIDQQLYRKYNLSQDEIDFIETKVQAMD